MPRVKLQYKVGDWIAIPVGKGEYGIGRIARSARGGKVLLGYFFGQKWERVPTDSEIRHLKPEGAVLIRIFGDLGLIEGEWHVIGNSGDWDKDLWPMPPFIRVDVISGKARKIEDSEDNILDFTKVRETPCTLDEAQQYPENGMSGSEALADRLKDLLSNS